MAEKLFIFEEEPYIEEFTSLLDGMGIKWERIGNVVKVDKIRDEELLYVFSELSDEALKSLRFYEGEVDTSSRESLRWLKLKLPMFLLINLFTTRLERFLLIQR
ncbi:hypothetical protein [Aquifex sp.]